MYSVGKKIAASGSGAGRAGYKAYTPPLLVCLGDVRDLTLGGSPGTGDTGAALVERPPGSSSLPGLDGLDALP